MWSLGRPTSAELDAEIARIAGLPLSCDVTPFRGEKPSGGSPPDARPTAYRRDAHAIEIDADFDVACEALQAFATHRLPYMFVHPPDARVSSGLDIVVCAGIGPLWTINPCRVTRVTSEPSRFEYAYATLPGHAEHGEETFSVTRLPGDRMLAETIAYSRPQDLLARIGAPVAHAVQRRIKRDYMAALAASARRVAGRTSTSSR